MRRLHLFPALLLVVAASACGERPPPPEEPTHPPAPPEASIPAAPAPRPRGDLTHIPAFWRWPPASATADAAPASKPRVQDPVPPRPAALPRARGLRSPAPAVTPPADPPPLGAGVVWRLEYVYPGQGVRVAGTGFIVRDTADCDYLLTCAHVLDARPGQAHGSLRMRTMDGSQVIRSSGAAIHVGRAVDLTQRGADGRPDMTYDFAVRLVSGRGARPLTLAKKDPAVGDRVWVIGQEVGQPPAPEYYYPGTIDHVADGGFVMKQLETFNAHGFSGGPVVNARGEVVGNVLTGGAGFVGGATVSTIRARLAEEGITVD
jgi:S1-C subfamily serine protease